MRKELTKEIKKITVEGIDFLIETAELLDGENHVVSLYVKDNDGNLDEDRIEVEGNEYCWITSVNTEKFAGSLTDAEMTLVRKAFYEVEEYRF